MSKMGNMESDTDFNSVTVISKRGPVSKVLKSQADVNAAKRSGAAIDTQKKNMSGGNRQHTSNKDVLRLDLETEVLHHDRVSLSLGKVLQQARAAKGWTQKDLATRANEKTQVVTEYENGKAVPNQQILAKLERALGVRLRGKELGAPLGQKAPPAKK